ncbi:MAG TPA: efflux RND transporter periplasmic adaptor subunit [Cyclobacteriaceae bacterium]|nr:efflux RND transporter periplasmic adaptor subunit [Cyclobacteriaceae bacterium]
MANLITKLLLLISLILALASCGGKGQAGAAGGPPTPPPVQITTFSVKAVQANYFDEYPAILRSINEVELRPQVNGYITGIHFTEGTRVSKGQKLYSIDQQSYEANYNQAVANLQVQEANLERAKKDVERYRELAKNDAIAKQQVDYAEATYAAAVKQVEAAKASVQNVQTNVRYSTIVAPFDGRIGISNVRLGAAVSAGQTVLNSISSDDPIAADISIDQKEILRFSKLQNASAKDSIFHLAISDQDYPGAGQISVIDRAVDPQTGSIRARLTFPNSDLVLRPGMSAKVKVKSPSDEQAIVVPYKAVTEMLGEFFVYVIGADNKASQTRVILGKQVGNNVIVKTGLKEGDKIAVEGVQNLREGSIVAEAPAK